MYYTCTFWKSICIYVDLITSTKKYFDPSWLLDTVSKCAFFWCIGTSHHLPTRKYEKKLTNLIIVIIVTRHSSNKRIKRRFGGTHLISIRDHHFVISQSCCKCWAPFVTTKCYTLVLTFHDKEIVGQYSKLTLCCTQTSFKNASCHYQQARTLNCPFRLILLKPEWTTNFLVLLILWPPSNLPHHHSIAY